VLGAIRITPVERITIRVERIGAAVMGYASREPVALLVRGPEGEHRLELKRGAPEA